MSATPENAGKPENSENAQRPRRTEPSTAAGSASASVHLDVVIERPWREVYDYVSDPRNLPRWAAGLAGGDVQREVSQWSMNSPMGRVLVSFVPENAYGVLDHTVTLPDGESTLNPMRVLPLDEQRSEVLFTLRRGSMSDQELEEDASAVSADLAELKRVLESS
ncbi:SRPBCC family protein [Brachybacterium sp. GCM10030268]|uniref:SRPBCC family protein n=1 Tax=Brachybacterium sp. GCM10030268 TaxID=3273382 RepID=UPI00361F7F2F